MNNILHVILTGGVGSRLWPLSRKSRPKQYLNIFGNSSLQGIDGNEGPGNSNEQPNHSLFELAVKRNTAFSNGLIVVGNQGNRQLSEAGLEKLEIRDYMDIVEATPRNTAPAIAFAAFAAAPEDILLVTPADHIIKEGQDYQDAVSEAISLAQDDAVVTFGVRPTKPETGYGYIEHAGNEVLSFREKPDRSTAEKFIKGKFLWNSGMFCFKAGIYLEELKEYAPEVYQKSWEAWKKASNKHLEKNSSLEIPSISMDYAVMEKSKRIKVVQSNFEWSDMGSFEAVYEHLAENGHPVDEHGNMQIGDQKFTAFAGLKNCIFVSTEDANLILSKEASQEVKKIYQSLENAGSKLIE